MSGSRLLFSFPLWTLTSSTLLRVSPTGTLRGWEVVTHSNEVRRGKTQEKDGRAGATNTQVPHRPSVPGLGKLVESFYESSGSRVQLSDLPVVDGS